MEGGALLTDDFVKFSKDYVLFCHITTQIATDKHADLLEQKGGQGFPHIVFMDAEGNVLAEHQADRTAAAFGKTGEKAKEFLALKAKAAKGDKAAQIDFIIAQLSMGQLKVEEAEKKIKEAGTPTKEQQAKLDGELVNVMVLDTVKSIQDEDGAKAAGKKFYDLEKAGKAGPTSEQAVQPYYILMMKAADDLKDAVVFEAALKALKAKFADNPNAKGFFLKNDKRLEELKAPKKEEPKEEKKEEKK